jgi:hypothetical protein
MVKRKSASKQAGGGAGGSRSPNSRPPNKNRSANTGNRDCCGSFIRLRCTNVLSARNASSKPLTSSNQASHIKAQIRESNASTPPETLRTDASRQVLHQNPHDHKSPQTIHQMVSSVSLLTKRCQPPLNVMFFTSAQGIGNRAPKSQGATGKHQEMGTCPHEL